VTVLLALPTVVPLLNQDQLVVTREVGAVGETQRVKEGYLADLLSARKGRAQAAAGDFLETHSPVTARLRDISCGGAGLILPQEQRPEHFLQRVALLHIPLPPFLLNSQARQFMHFTLKILGVIRAARAVPSAVRLHIRFLERLPDEFALLFAHLG
jgi:hypothetical protein